MTGLAFTTGTKPEHLFAGFVLTPCLAYLAWHLTLIH